jgi:hypothetical protein
MALLQLGILFAQMNRQPGPQGGGAGGVLGMCMCYSVAFVIAFAIQILFLVTLSKCLAACSPRNRTMEPGMVWLNLIPLFGIVWMFITIIRISESLQNEYDSRRMHTDDPDFGKMMGILYMVLSLVCGPVGLIFFIIYWVKIAGFKNALLSGGRGGDEDDYDDGPRRGRRRRDEIDDEDDDRRRHDDDR